MNKYYPKYIYFCFFAEIKKKGCGKADKVTPIIATLTTLVFQNEEGNNSQKKGISFAPSVQKANVSMSELPGE